MYQFDANAAHMKRELKKSTCSPLVDGFLDVACHPKPEAQTLI